MSEGDQNVNKPQTVIPVDNTWMRINSVKKKRLLDQEGGIYLNHKQDALAMDSKNNLMKWELLINPI